LRLISFTATLTTTALIGFIAHRESKQRWLGFACAGLFLGGYRITGFWYELARVDALAVMLTLLGLALGVYAANSRARLVLSALTLALAFFTKQTALAFGLSFAAYGLWCSFVTHNRAASLWDALRFTLWFILPFAAFLLLPLFTVHFLTDNWFFFYIFTAASADAKDILRVWRYVGLELFGGMGALTVTALVAALLTVRRVGWRGLWARPWFVMLGVAALVSGAGRASVGGNLNNLMPVYALLCLAPALCFYPDSPSSAKNLGMGLASLALLLQLALGVYNPLRYLPTPAMREQGHTLVAQLQKIDGPVLAMIQPYYAWRAGKAPSAQVASLWHLHQWLNLPWPADVVERIESHYYSAIVSDETLFETDPSLHQLLMTNYPFTQTLIAPPTLTGVMVRPTTLYLPRP
jgi:hypothetical protein